MDTHPRKAATPSDAATHLPRNPAAPSALRARASLCLAMAIVGSSVVAGKYVVLSMPVYLSLWLRFAIAFAVMLPLLFLREGGLPRAPRTDWLLLFAQAGCGGFLFNALLLEGLRHTDAPSAGIITATGPACAMLVSCLMLGERLTRRTLLAVCLSFSGIALLHAGNPETISAPARQITAYGTLLVFGAVMAESLFLLLGKRLRTRITPLAASTLLCGFCTVQFFPLALPQLLAGGMSGMSYADALVIAWYALGITVGAYLLWFSGVAHVRGAEAGLYTGIMPISALLFSSMLPGNVIGWQHAAGCTAVLLGIAAAALPYHPARQRLCAAAQSVGSERGK